MSIGDIVASSKVFEQGVWFQPGIYDVTVRDVSAFMSSNGKGQMVAVRFGVNSCVPTEDTNHTAFPPGSQASCVFVLASQVGPSNLKALLITAGKALAVQEGGIPEDVTNESLKKEDYELFCSPASPIVGLRLKATCFTKKSKVGKPFVAIAWSVPE